MKKLILILTLSLSAPSAFSGSATGGATEITQLANNIELMANVAENARQSAVQMNQLYTALQNIQSFGGLSSIEQKMGLPSGSLSQAASSTGSIKNLKFTINGIRADSDKLEDKAKILVAAYKAALKTYEKTGIPPSKLLEEAKKSNEEEAKQYRKRADNIRKQATGVVEDIDRINGQSRGISSITGNVKGLQYLAGQNVEIQRTMKETNLLLLQSMEQKQLDAETRLKKEKIELDKKSEMEKKDRERFKKTMTFGPEAWRKAMGD